MEAKRPREESQEEKDENFEEYTKRHKPYNHIISLLDSEEEDSTEDLSPLISTLQQEITCASKNPDSLLISPAQENDHNTLTPSIVEESNSNQQVLKDEEENEKERVMRHLLQASDDELGIPNTGVFGEDGFNGEDGFSSLGNKLWELEDETANYYALMQSELFLWGY